MAQVEVKPSHPYPQYFVHWKTGTGELVKPFSFSTPIESQGASTDFIELLPDGFLLLRKGYVWDFGSGAWDTPDIVYASLAHDAFYELMELGLLPKSYRKKVDRYFRQILKDSNTRTLRRTYVYLAVRFLYPIVRRFRMWRGSE